MGYEQDGFRGFLKIGLETLLIGNVKEIVRLIQNEIRRGIRKKIVQMQHFLLAARQEVQFEIRHILI